MANYTSTQTTTQSLTATLFKSLYLQMSAALTITGLVSLLPIAVTGIPRHAYKPFGYDVDYPYRSDWYCNTTLSAPPQDVDDYSNAAIHPLLGYYGCNLRIDLLGL